MSLLRRTISYVSDCKFFKIHIFFIVMIVTVTWPWLKIMVTQVSSDDTPCRHKGHMKWNAFVCVFLVESQVKNQASKIIRGCFCYLSFAQPAFFTLPVQPNRCFCYQAFSQSGFFMLGFRPVRFFHARNSSSQMFSLYSSQPIRFSHARNQSIRCFAIYLSSDKGFSG